VQIALRIIVDECVEARLATSSTKSDVEDLRMELEDIQRQHNEVLHDLSDAETEVKRYFGGIGVFGKLYAFLFSQSDGAAEAQASSGNG
jgi:soluble cytochrome b562